MLCVGINPLPSFAQTDSEAIEDVNTLQDKIYGLSLLWSELKYNFVNADRLPFDIDSLYRTTMLRVVETPSDAAYYTELERFLAAFNDGHTALIDKPDSGWEDTDYPKYNTNYIDGKFYFTRYRLSDDADPRLLGAEIVEIEGMPAMKYAEKYVFPTITASNDNFRRMHGGQILLNGITGTIIKGKAICRDGQTIDFNIIRNGEAVRTDKDEYMPRRAASSNHDPVWYEFKNDIAIMTVDRFWPDEISTEIDRAMTEIKSRNPKGLIIDLRKNGGGSTDVALRLQMHLTDADSLLSFGAQTRTNSAYGRAQGNYLEEYADYYNYRAYETFPPENIARDNSIEPIRCPVAVLIGPGCFSACEDFLVNIYEMPNRPILIGEQTSGSTGAPLVLELPHEAAARICTIRITYPYSGRLFDGGIKPDIEVKKTLDDYLDPEAPDRVMDKAIYALNKLIN